MFGMLSVLAELQRELIVANTRDRLAAARARGRTGGRRPQLTPAQALHAQKLYDAGDHTVQQIADLLGVPRPTVYGHLDKATIGKRPNAGNGPPTTLNAGSCTATAQTLSGLVPDTCRAVRRAVDADRRRHRRGRRPAAATMAAVPGGGRRGAVCRHVRDRAAVPRPARSAARQPIPAEPQLPAGIPDGARDHLGRGAGLGAAASARWRSASRAISAPWRSSS
jgi:hypothetical protein